jgi:Ankyrin repeat
MSRRNLARREVEGAMVSDDSHFEDEPDAINGSGINGGPRLAAVASPRVSNTTTTATSSSPARAPARRLDGRVDGVMGGVVPPLGGGMSSTVASSSAASGGGAEDDEPARLFSMLEEALPAQTEAARPLTTAELQLKRDLAEHTWDLVRRWMWTHPHPEQRRAAAYIRGAADATPLHLMCKVHNPPDDIIAAMVEAAIEIVSWTDAHGWLPLHHACANGASPEVMRLLIDAYPAGKLQQDNQSRTPLHFYATRSSDNPAFMTVNAELLSDTGAAELTDRGGMLPMHYACAVSAIVFFCILHVSTIIIFFAASVCIYIVEEIFGFCSTSLRNSHLQCFFFCIHVARSMVPIQPFCKYWPLSIPKVSRPRSTRVERRCIWPW